MDETKKFIIHSIQLLHWQVLVTFESFLCFLKNLNHAMWHARSGIVGHYIHPLSEFYNFIKQA